MFCEVKVTPYREQNRIGRIATKWLHVDNCAPLGRGIGCEFAHKKACFGFLYFVASHDFRRVRSLLIWIFRRRFPTFTTPLNDFFCVRTLHIVLDLQKSINNFDFCPTLDSTLSYMSSF